MTAGEDGYTLAAEFEIELGSRLEDAVARGVPLFFNLEFVLERPRKYWISEHIVTRSLTYKLAYSSLMRQYRLSTGHLHQNFGSLAEAMRVVGRIAALPVLEKDDLKAGETYEAAVRLSLDRSQLPKPFQVDAIMDRDYAGRYQGPALAIRASRGGAMRVALAVIAALGAILLFLLASASANTALFAANYSWLLAINGAAAVALLVLVGLQLRRLRRDFKGGVFGSRLKSRLLLMLSLMAVLPGALVYGVSMQFAVKSIDSWFDVRVDTALEGGLNLGRSVLDSLQADLLAKARDAALDLGDSGFVSPSRLNRLREQTGAQSATLLTLSGQVLGRSSGEMGSLLPTVPAPSQLRAARAGRGLAQIGEAENGGLLVRALVPVNSSGLES